MAEETVVAIFGSYAGFHFLDLEKRNQANVIESSRAKAMAKIREVACAESGFPVLKWKGCNVSAPIFHQEGAGRRWVRTSTRTNPYQPAMEVYTTGGVFPTIRTDVGHLSAQVWLDPNLDFKINEKAIAVGDLQTGQLYSLKFEVVADKSRHPDPYIVVPDVGLYESFHEASSLAICIDTADPDTGKWTRTRLHHLKPLNRLETDPGDTEYHCVPEAFIQVTKILQLLEGTQWESTSLDFPKEAYSVASMQHIHYDHLRQTIEMVNIAHPRTKKPLPKRMSFQENADLMFKLHPELIIGPSERPDRSVLLPNTPMTNKQANAVRCDFCLVVGSRKDAIAQCREGSRQCQVCRLYLNRPCTWHDRATVKWWLANGDPLHLFYGPAKLPTCEDIAEPFGAGLLIEALVNKETS
ncbi:hypothetical protein LQW54_006478 [Pestalotiopsis sp. IQ-011]